jgi:hypothetical protein
MDFHLGSLSDGEHLLLLSRLAPELLTFFSTGVHHRLRLEEREIEAWMEGRSGKYATVIVKNLVYVVYHEKAKRRQDDKPFGI